MYPCDEDHGRILLESERFIDAILSPWWCRADEGVSHLREHLLRIKSRVLHVLFRAFFVLALLLRCFWLAALVATACRSFFAETPFLY